MRIAVNAISATAGGARTYLLNLARILPALGAHEYQLYIPSAAAPDLAALPSNFRLLTSSLAESGYSGRLLWEQFVLPRRILRWGADVLLCVGNFCPLWSPVPVLLLSRNPLYFTPRFLEDLLERGHYLWALRHAAMTRLAVWSARAARLTVTPTAAMAEMVRGLAGRRPPALRTIFHGFQPWPNQNGHSAPSPTPFRFLLVGHYNYFRNFETVFHALARVRAERPVQLILTTRLAPGLRQGGYDTTRACRLLDRLALRDSLTMLGAVPYDQLPAVYASAHAVICPAYAESFNHTVVEAMSMGLPVIASDIPVHREVSGGHALFFPSLDPGQLAACCYRLMDDKTLRSSLRAAGLARAKTFSWRGHFEKLLAAAAEVAR